ncbi:MAG: RimJ/RimL family protein N-acetyltransferase [Planctomycetota bacterium]|jgi:RimJ/RimL family protein N-acetyltransferase
MNDVLISQPAYRIETRRLILRCYEPRDTIPLIDAVQASSEHLSEWLPWALDEPHSIDEKLAQVRGFRAGFDLGTNFVYGVFDPATGELIGGTGLHPRNGPGGAEIGYWIAHDRCGRGYATELTAVLARVGIELHGLDRIEIHVHPDNEASQRIPVKLGFQLEGRLRRRLRVLEGPMSDKLVYSLLSDELKSSTCMDYSYEAYDAMGRPL